MLIRSGRSGEHLLCMTHETEHPDTTREDPIMTDIKITLTGLTAVAKKAEVTPDQARTILEAVGVKVQPEKPPLPTEPGSAIIATKVRGVTGKWRMLLNSDGEWASPVRIGGNYWHRPHHITAWTEAVVVPAPKRINPDDVREGDRVRLELESGVEVTITVTGVRESWIESHYDAYPRHTICAIHLLDREGDQ